MNSSGLCPLYREGRQVAAKGRPGDANMGLWFDKFASGWTTQKDRWEFDAPTSISDGSSWLAAQKGVIGDRALLKDFSRRQACFARSRSGIVLYFRNSSRFASGLGRNHPLENGLAWHHTLGVPYLPGSSLKGVLRAWQRETEGERIERPGRGYSYRLPEPVLRRFGDEEGAGDLIFLDLLPRSAVELVPDVMTPHYGPYYQSGAVPGDWLSPVPIQFLTVEKGAEWQLCIVPRTRKASESLVDFGDVVEEALAWAGAGAKTAVGYGRFERCRELEEREHQAEVKRQLEVEAQVKRLEELSNLPEDVRKLEERAEQENWLGSDRGKVKEALKSFISERTELSVKAAHWWRDKVFEPADPGMWSNPSASKWQKKAKKKEWADLALQLKKLAGLD